MSGIIKKAATKKESLTTKLILIIVGLTAGSGLLIPATYASFHPVTPEEIADNTILSADIRNGEVRNSDIETSAVTSGKISDTAGVYSVDIVNGTVRSVDIGDGQVASADILDGTITSQDIASGTIPSGSTPADNSVTSAKIADSEVKSVDIGNGEVFSVDIGDGQVASADILDGTITSTDLAYDAIQLTRVEGNPVTVAPGRGGAAYVDCPPGQVVTGGGFGFNRAGPYLPAVNVVTSYPHDLDTWFIGGLNEGNVVLYFQAFAVCVQGQGNFVAPIVNSTSAMQN